MSAVPDYAAMQDAVAGLLAIGAPQLLAICVALLSFNTSVSNEAMWAAYGMLAAVLKRWVFPCSLGCSGISCCAAEHLPLQCRQQWQELDAVEFFSGKEAVSNAWRANGWRVASFDYETGGRPMDLLSPAGMASASQLNRPHARQCAR